MKLSRSIRGKKKTFKATLFINAEKSQKISHKAKGQLLNHSNCSKIMGLLNDENVHQCKQNCYDQKYQFATTKTGNKRLHCCCCTREMWQNAKCSYDRGNGGAPKESCYFDTYFMYKFNDASLPAILHLSTSIVIFFHPLYPLIICNYRSILPWF